MNYLFLEERTAQSELRIGQCREEQENDRREERRRRHGTWQSMPTAIFPSKEEQQQHVVELKRKEDPTKGDRHIASDTHCQIANNQFRTLGTRKEHKRTQERTGQ